jgi:hypothetical protein
VNGTTVTTPDGDGTTIYTGCPGAYTYSYPYYGGYSYPYYGYYPYGESFCLSSPKSERVEAQWTCMHALAAPDIVSCPIRIVLYSFVPPLMALSRFIPFSLSLLQAVPTTHIPVTATLTLALWCPSTECERGLSWHDGKRAEDACEACQRRR